MSLSMYGRGGGGGKQERGGTGNIGAVVNMLLRGLSPVLLCMPTSPLKWCEFRPPRQELPQTSHAVLDSPNQGGKLGD